MDRNLLNHIVKRFILFLGITLILIATFYPIWVWDIGPENPCDFLISSYSPQVISREGRTLWAGLNEKEQWCLPVHINSVSQHLIHATVALEDKRFWQHHGVDLLAIGRAIIQNIHATRAISGASTITMQVVKQYYRQNGYTVPDSILEKLHFKFLQSVQAIRLERYTTKREILQAYLNNVSYGGNLVGVESAAWRYFGKTTENLSLSESAMLAGIPQSPEIYRPDKNLSRSLKKMRYVLRRMNKEGYISGEQYANGIKSRIQVDFYPFPNHCQHWAEKEEHLLNEKRTVHTCLGYDIQCQAEEILKQKVQQWTPEVTIASAMVVDVSTGEILARVGGISQDSRTPVSYLDFCSVPRSPGSALKPFLYCFAMEKGLLFPEETLLDSDFDTGSYSPKNFDEVFHGFIDATTALRYSLNIPAVLLLQRVGTGSFAGELKKCGLNFDKYIQKVKEPGLGFVLGNCEVSMEEMMNAYACLANEGQFKPLKILKEGQDEQSVQVLDHGATLILYQMMEGMLTGEVARDSARLSREPVRICWKTGTSSGRRDSWAFVFNKHYLVGVWMGNPQFKGSPKLVGALTAYPTACEIFRSLPQKKGSEFPDFPTKDVKPIQVCSLSGLPANPYCKFKKQVYVSSNVPLSRVCDVHYYNIQSGQVRERFPSQSKGWDLSRIGFVPNRGGEAIEAKVNLKILTPADGSKFVYSSNTTQNTLQLQSSRDNIQTIYWYVDDRFLGESSAENLLQWNFTPGKHKIHCLDLSDNDDTVYVEIIPPEKIIKIANIK